MAALARIALAGREAKRERQRRVEKERVAGWETVGMVVSRWLSGCNLSPYSSCVSVGGNCEPTMLLPFPTYPNPHNVYRSDAFTFTLAQNGKGQDPR